MKTRHPIRLIKSSEIKEHFTIAEAIDAMAEAFESLSSGNSEVPQRYVTTFGKESLSLLVKPVFVQSENRAALKILTQKEMGKVKGIPAIVGVVMLLDTLTGEILAIMDGEYLTALRTGAASGLATKYFARKNAKTMAIFGCGAQGKTQLEAVSNVRNISKIWLFDKNRKSAESLISELKTKINADIEIADNLNVLKECDIICTATNSEKPLFHLEHLKEGVHINAIGSFKPSMQEIDPNILLNASIFVDQKETCLAESGDLIKPINYGLFSASHIKGEIGDYALGNNKGRTSEEEITVFKSVGVAIQDYVVASKIYEKSISHSFGKDFNLFD